MAEIATTIKYECPHCGHGYGTVTHQTYSLKLSCDRCHKYIKFISKKEFHEGEAAYQTELLNAAFPENESAPTELQEINFKLDLIISHLGIEA